MMNQANLVLSHSDYEKISALIFAAHTETADLLAEEIDRASIVPDDQLPKDVVAMNSIVSFKDLDTGLQATVTLVYPHEANIEEQLISILAPIGSALIGLKVGDDISWPLPNGKEKRVRVNSVKPR